MENYDLVILFSGGSDSRLLVEFAKQMKKNFLVLMVDYGQLNVEELEFAEKCCLINNWDYKKVKVDLPINSGLTGDGIKNESGDVHYMHVPGRNTIFLSMAYSIAENLKISQIWIGCDWSDRINLFPDCYQDYIVKMNEVFQIAGPNKISVECPLLGFSKENVNVMIKSYGINQTTIYSGYGEFDKK
jgi:7-cyano-7-deazaguanine synthase